MYNAVRAFDLDFIISDGSCFNLDAGGFGLDENMEMFNTSGLVFLIKLNVFWKSLSVSVG